ncbi:MAG: DUF385 domain-containing protein [Gammaproteobacteria bacterium]|nr:DUF385 domain-containing protein [Gammaproteobacteria bacterium]
MRIPEPFFPLINRAMKILLDSPLHGLMSNSVLTIRFTGRRTGRVWSLPVRYLREDGGGLLCLTSRDAAWWQNFLEPTPVELQLAGERVAAIARSVTDDASRKEAALRRLLERFPGDAPYHGVSARGEGFEAAVADAVLVHFALGD